MIAGDSEQMGVCMRDYLVAIAFGLTVFTPSLGLPADPAFVVRAKNNTLTLRAANAPLQDVLNEIVDQLEIPLVVHGELKGLLSAEFSEVPLEEGLKRLIGGFNHVFIYDAAKVGQEDPPLRKIIIYAENTQGMGERPPPRSIAPSPQPSQGQEKIPFDVLVKALNDKDPENREDAVDSLAESGDARAVSHLTKVLLNDQDEDVRESAAMALEDLGDERAVAPLIKALEDPYAGVRESAVDALSVIGGEEVIRPLMGLLRDEDEDVREAVAEALKKLTGKDFES